MSLVTLAIVGKDNAPLYLCDFDDHEQYSKSKQKQQQQQQNSIRNDSEVDEENDDTFGFFETNAEKMNESFSFPPSRTRITNSI